jgi:hypothetical protein
MYKITDRDIHDCDWYTKTLLGKWCITSDEDDIQVGRLAMCEAVNHPKHPFDPEKKYKLITFALHYIRKALFSKYFNNYNGRKGPMRGCMFKNRTIEPCGESQIDVAPKNTEKIIINDITTKELLSKMPYELSNAIVKKIMYGINYKDSGKEIGISSATLSKRIKKWRNEELFS